ALVAGTCLVTRGAEWPLRLATQDFADLQVPRVPSVSKWYVSFPCLKVGQTWAARDAPAVDAAARHAELTTTSVASFTFIGGLRFLRLARARRSSRGCVRTGPWPAPRPRGRLRRGLGTGRGRPRPLGGGS